MSSKQSDRAGSINSKILVVIILAVLVVVGLVVMLLGGGDDEASVQPAANSDASNDDGASSQTPPPAGDQTADADPTATTPSSGDYTVANVFELSPVCASGSFPSGLVASSSGQKTVPFLQEEVGGDYRYLSNLASSGSDLAPDSTTSNEVDRVACIRATGTEAFQEPCSGDGTDFELVGYEFDLVVYDIHSGQELGTSKLTHSRDCPLFAVLVGGRADAAVIDRQALEDYLNSLNP